MLANTAEETIDREVAIRSAGFISPGPRRTSLWDIVILTKFGLGQVRKEKSV